MTTEAEKGLIKLCVPLACNAIVQCVEEITELLDAIAETYPEAAEIEELAPLLAGAVLMGVVEQSRDSALTGEVRRVFTEHVEIARDEARRLAPIAQGGQSDDD